MGDLTFGLSGGSSTFGRAVFSPVPCLFGLCLRGEPVASSGRGDAVTPQRRGRGQAPRPPRAPAPGSGWPFLLTHALKVWTLLGGAWSPSPPTLPLLYPPPLSLLQPRFSSSSLPPPPFPLSSSPRRALGARDWRRAAVRAPRAGASEGPGRGPGLRPQVDSPAERAAGRAEGGARGRGRRGLGRWPTPGRSVKRRERQASGPGTREAAAARARRSLLGVC